MYEIWITCFGILKIFHSKCMESHRFWNISATVRDRRERTSLLDTSGRVRVGMIFFKIFGRKKGSTKFRKQIEPRLGFFVFRARRTGKKYNMQNFKKIWSARVQIFRNFILEDIKLKVYSLYDSYRKGGSFTPSQKNHKCYLPIKPYIPTLDKIYRDRYP